MLEINAQAKPAYLEEEERLRQYNEEQDEWFAQIVKDHVEAVAKMKANIAALKMEQQLMKAAQQGD